METDDATVRIARGTSPAPADGAQFAPGTVIGDRYRIASLLGSGGMGEVYRADDLKLNQHVALKFLPAALANDAHYLEQLHGEVRLGRQVAHPNVCRVYDIGEAASTHYIAMEYVDGEDLGRLLRRIGRLAHDKAVEIARGIAAGLAAAHAKGILHRDLKPANIMIDSRGEPRITDFGLALANEDANAANQAGTPAYMAPEQFSGAAASVQTDLYALGLVLYEIFTGKRARQATTLAELRTASGSQISLPSTVVRDIDVAVERLILRCLERDPTMRPQSAREVFNALPGGDPLAAALAAGETPSPRLVAAADVEGSLSRRAAWSWVAAIVVMFAAMMFLMRGWSIASLAPMEIAPPLLEARALDVARIIGIPPQRFRTARFEREYEYMGWLGDHDRAVNPWKRLRTGPQPISLLVRVSPEPIVPRAWEPLTAPDDPPIASPGMCDVQIDTLGRLVSLHAYPRGATRGTPDWNALLAVAGLDSKSVKAVPSRELPPFYADTRIAWDASYADAPAVPLHIEAAAANGAPVWFSVGGPWSGSRRNQNRNFSGPLVAVFKLIFGTLICILTTLLAWNNYRRRRIDRTAVMRVGVTIFLLQAISFLLLVRHQLNFSAEVAFAQRMLGTAFVTAAVFALLYAGLEPYVRRRWPELLISWLRLVEGKLRDPMIGRDLLIGVAAGVAHAMIATLTNVLPGILGMGRTGLPRTYQPSSLDGFGPAFGLIIEYFSNATLSALAIMVLLVAMTLIFRRRSIAVAAVFVVSMLWFGAAGGGRAPVLVAGVLLSLLYVTLAVRVGFLALIAMEFTFFLTFAMPLPIEPNGWMFAASFVPVVTVATIIVYAFRTSLAGQTAFSGSLLDD